MASLPNLVNVPCHLGGAQTLTLVPNGAGLQFAYANMVAVLCKTGATLVLTTIYNAVLAGTARPAPDFGSTGLSSAPTGIQRWPLKL